MTGTRLPARGAALAVTAVAALSVLTACGGDEGSSAASPSPTMATQDHNKADVAFAKGMIPHHRQAVGMSELAESRASSEQVKDLAARIEKAQRAEIKTMSGWLKSWDEKVPHGMGEMHDGHMDGSEMPGMMDRKEMGGLRNSSGKNFDSKFLTMMVSHHEGALEMAETENKGGKYQPAKDLADDVITTQKSEIKQMNRLLDKN